MKNEQFKKGKEIVKMSTTKIKQYRDKWLAEKVEDFVGFYNREFFCLDNFSSFGITYKDKYYATVEHAYQAGKFFKTAPNVAEDIRLANSAYKAKILASENADKVDPNFADFKVELMEELLRCKLAEHPYVVKKLLETEDCLICEDSPKDEFWGIGANRDGQNNLGKLWMKLRAEIRADFKAHHWNCHG